MGLLGSITGGIFDNPNNALYYYLEPVNVLYFGATLNPPKQGLLQSKQGSFGFQVYITKMWLVKFHGNSKNFLQIQEMNNPNFLHGT